MRKATQANGQKKAPATVITLNQGQAYDLSNNNLTRREAAGKELFAKGKVRPYMPRITSEPEPVFVYAEVDGYCVDYEIVDFGIIGSMHCDCPDKEHNLNSRELCEHLCAARCYVEVNREALLKESA